MEVSAKTGYQVTESFTKTAELLLNKIEKNIIDVKSDVTLFFINSLQESRLVQVQL